MPRPCTANSNRPASIPGQSGRAFNRSQRKASPIAEREAEPPRRGAKQTGQPRLGSVERNHRQLQRIDQPVDFRLVDPPRRACRRLRNSRPRRFSPPAMRARRVRRLFPPGAGKEARTHRGCKESTRTSRVLLALPHQFFRQASIPPDRFANDLLGLPDR